MPLPVDRRREAELRDERYQPEAHEQHGAPVDERQVTDVAREVLAVEEEEDARRRRVEERHRVAESRDGEYHRPRAPVTVLLDAAVDEPEKQHGEGEPGAVGELAGEGARDVAAPHRVPLVEEEQQARHRAERRYGEGIAERTERERRHERQEEAADHRHELEGDVQRDHGRERHDRQRRRQEIELVGGVAAEVAEVPALRHAGGEQRVAQMMDGTEEGRRVAAGNRGVEE